MKREPIVHIEPEMISAQEKYAAIVREHPDKPKSYHIVTFGCQMNSHDSETLAGTLSHMGLEQAADRTEADLVLFNTCCIRDNAERKALGNITWLNEVKKRRPGMLIGICGCMMQQKGMAETVLKKYPFVDLAFGTGTLYRLPEYLYQIVDEKRRVIDVSREESTIAEGLPILRDSAFKAYINIMYGCNNFCSYCVVPYVRGRERSRSPEIILSEAKELVADGYKKITLLGQNVNSYGNNSDFGVNFSSLIKMIDGIEGDWHFDFMTSHPKDCTFELINTLASSKHFCGHLHLPVQSGNDRILKEMNRHYTREHYLSLIEYAKRKMPDIDLTTDIIVGFPGETYDEFRDTLSLVKEVKFDSMFTFIFSPRKGTRAAEMPDPFTKEEKTAWFMELLALQEKIASEKSAHKD